jgi:hypothetical protein
VLAGEVPPAAAGDDCGDQIRTFGGGNERRVSERDDPARRGTHGPAPPRLEDGMTLVPAFGAELTAATLILLAEREDASQHP